MAKKILTAVTMVLLVFLLIAQFLTIQRTNPPLKGDLGAPPQIKTLLRVACYDCHFNETRWPWYTYIAPVSWLIAHDVERGREELNFSEWGSYYPATRIRKLQWMGRALRRKHAALDLSHIPSEHRPHAARLDDSETMNRGRIKQPARKTIREKLQMKNYSLFATLLLLLAVFVLCPNLAAAQVDPWEFEVYPYRTMGRGVLEIETNNAIVANGHREGGSGLSSGTFPSYGMWFNEYEFTYGVTDRIEAAGYLDLAKPNSHGLTYAGSKFRLRGRLFDEEVLPIDLGWYLEIEYRKNPQFNDATLEFEMRIPMQKDIGPLSVLFNPIFEKPVTGPEKHLGFEFGYSAAVYYRWMRALTPGIEFYGGIGNINNPEPKKEQQHYIFPVVKGELPHGLEYNFGVGVGLTHGSDRVVVKFNVELEKYIGAIFGPSSDTGWLW